MSLIINPGSGAVGSGDGWTNTYEGAAEIAREWLDLMCKDGFGHDIELLDDPPAEEEGRWTFRYRHKVTGAIATLETAGIDNMAAFLKVHIFGTRTYWNGSSSSNPELSDWAADGYVQTYRETGS